MPPEQAEQTNELLTTKHEVQLTIEEQLITQEDEL